MTVPKEITAGGALLMSKSYLFQRAWLLGFGIFPFLASFGRGASVQNVGRFLLLFRQLEIGRHSFLCHRALFLKKKTNLIAKNIVLNLQLFNIE